MKTNITLGTTTLSLMLSSAAVAALVDTIPDNPGMVVTVGAPGEPVDSATTPRSATIIVYGYSLSTNGSWIIPEGVQKIPAVKALRHATNPSLGLFEAKQALEAPGGRYVKNIMPGSVSSLIADLRTFGYQARRVL